jgi:hypothetical protein
LCKIIFISKKIVRKKGELDTGRIKNDVASTIRKGKSDLYLQNNRDE